ncbi:fms-related tyrosine kinase 3 ligand isoform X2 [Ambystoma mexicanum]|uniref:fms-related tyrosine kinase 3 ligand isoform X2 n=1 Tax=Ambystoma mexicanum TaxID=8296 RepID=UPI0037E7AC08
MNWCHALHHTISGACLVRLQPLPATVFMLAFITASVLSCNFSKFRVMTTVYEDQIKDLSDHLPLDYPVSVISNLQMDNWCFELWNLYFIKKELERMVSIAGGKLRPIIQKVTSELFLFEECKFTESSMCQTYQRMNVSDFLNQLTRQMNALDPKIQNDFSNCSAILCVPDNSERRPPPLESSSKLSVSTADALTETAPFSKYTAISQEYAKGALPQENPSAAPDDNKRVRFRLLAPLVGCAVVITLFIIHIFCCSCNRDSVR